MIGGMDDRELRETLARLEQKLDATRRAAEDTRRYFLWLTIAAVVSFLLPLLGLLFAVPAFLSTYAGLSGL